VTKILYHLDEVIIGSEVIVTEGEKDCDRVRELGLGGGAVKS
jgi:hypothetical protein